jgi:ubiquinone/menaquinone biosynthesis C-methylase UbiE
MNDERPAKYTHGHHESVLRGHQRRTAEDSAAYLLPHLTAGSLLMGIGCGPGTITADLAARVAPGPVLAVDQFADVLNVARAEAQRRYLFNVSFATADVHKLDFPDYAFDVVHAHQVLQQSPIRCRRCGR